jgi:hypothetical protein
VVYVASFDDRLAAVHEVSVAVAVASVRALRDALTQRANDLRSRIQSCGRAGRRAIAAVLGGGQKGEAVAGAVVRPRGALDDALAIDAVRKLRVIAGNPTCGAVVSIGLRVDFAAVSKVPVAVEKSGRAFGGTHVVDAARHEVRSRRARATRILRRTAESGIAERHALRPAHEAATTGRSVGIHNRRRIHGGIRDRARLVKLIDARDRGASDRDARHDGGCAEGRTAEDGKASAAGHQGQILQDCFAACTSRRFPLSPAVLACLSRPVSAI